MFVTAIIAAGGRGQRLGGARPKQLLSISGRPMLERSVTAFLTHPSIDEVVVALPAEFVADPPDYLRRAAKPLHIVAGGERRQDSVGNAFRAASPQSDVIVIHDAARPFVTGDLIARTIAAATEDGAALAALQARDTVKLAGPAKAGHYRRQLGPAEAGHYRRQFGPAKAGHHRRQLGPAEAGRHVPQHCVLQTLPRETIFLAQTPQAFRRSVLSDALALANAGTDATDEATLAERAGHPVRLVEGDVSNIKITTPDDVPLAEAIARMWDGPVRSAEPRMGIGYDLHRLVEGRPLILGGVTIPFERGLLGHSDADVICHAVTDAVLGAAAAGDIGRHFPDTDQQWKGASSIDLLRRASALAGERGYGVVNVDVIVIAECPKIGPYVDAMRAHVAEALGVAPDRVSIKGKTNEGVGELGRGEAIAVHAVALLQQA